MAAVMTELMKTDKATLAQLESSVVAFSGYVCMVNYKFHLLNCYQFFLEHYLIYKHSYGNYHLHRSAIGYSNVEMMTLDWCSSIST
jgi:hypothetical protein